MEEILKELEPIIEQLRELGYHNVHVTWDEKFLRAEVSIHGEKEKSVNK